MLVIITLLALTKKPLQKQRTTCILSLMIQFWKTLWDLLKAAPPFTHHFYGAVEQLHAERLEGGDKVNGERVSLLPEADQQADSDSSQDHGLSDGLVNRWPVPVDANVMLRHCVLMLSYLLKAQCVTYWDLLGFVGIKWNRSYIQCVHTGCICGYEVFPAFCRTNNSSYLL